MTHSQKYTRASTADMAFVPLEMNNIVGIVALGLSWTIRVIVCLRHRRSAAQATGAPRAPALSAP